MPDRINDIADAARKSSATQGAPDRAIAACLEMRRGQLAGQFGACRLEDDVGVSAPHKTAHPIHHAQLPYPNRPSVRLMDPMTRQTDFKDRACSNAY